jgi:hypothetical protein
LFRFRGNDKISEHRFIAVVPRTGKAASAPLCAPGSRTRVQKPWK